MPGVNGKRLKPAEFAIAEPLDEDDGWLSTRPDGCVVCTRGHPGRCPRCSVDVGLAEGGRDDVIRRGGRCEVTVGGVALVHEGDHGDDVAGVAGWGHAA